MTKEFQILMKKKQKNKYDINQCALYKCSNKRRLANLLYLSNDELKNLKNSITYYSFSKEKKDGKERKIIAPRNYIKKIQKRLLYLLTYIERPEWLISGERGKSYVDNGKSHLASDYFLTIDIQSFYDNCKREYVYRFFLDTMCVSKDIAELLSDIVTFDGGIPTGCPTSQLIAYYAYQEMFNNINDIGKKYGCKFTLYVDDMTFSSKGTFNPDQLANDIDIELRKYGHKPKYQKVKYFPKNSHKLITGVVVSKNHELLVANNLQKKIFVGAMNIKKSRLQKINPQIQNLDKHYCTIKGQIQAARQVNCFVFPEIERLLEKYINSN
jgi:RNA-directed DNA polymerase